MVGKKLRSLIKKKGIKQIVFAKRLNITSSRLSNYLNDKRKPSIELLAKMAKYLSVDLNYFTDINFREAEVSQHPVKAGKAVCKVASGALAVNLPFVSSSSKNGLTSMDKMPVSSFFLEKVEFPQANAILCEVAMNTTGEHFKRGDILLAARTDSIPLKNGMILIEPERCTAYRFVTQNKRHMLVSLDKNKIIPIRSDEELEAYHVLLWVFSRP